jgi:hypothetical protein
MIKAIKTNSKAWVISVWMVVHRCKECIGKAVGRLWLVKDPGS